MRTIAGLVLLLANVPLALGQDVSHETIAIESAERRMQTKRVSTLHAGQSKRRGQSLQHV